MELLTPEELGGIERNLSTARMFIAMHPEVDAWEAKAERYDADMPRVLEHIAALEEILELANAFFDAKREYKEKRPPPNANVDVATSRAAGAADTKRRLAMRAAEKAWREARGV